MSKQRAAKDNKNQTGLRLKPVTARTENQKEFLRNYNNYTLTSLEGCPGTGKTFLAMYAALNLVQKQSDTYKKVHVIRSAVAVRDVGFLKGSLQEKIAVYEAPYVSIATELYDRGDAYNILKSKGVIEFVSTSYLRGITLDNCVLIIDECQNMSFQELHTILTRVGDNCKVFMCGDIYQDDLTSERFKEVSGYGDILTILSRMDGISRIDFKPDDIVRSGFVRDYIMARVVPLAYGKPWNVSSNIVGNDVKVNGHDPHQRWNETKEFLLG